jgi:hypothetical protein
MNLDLLRFRPSRWFLSWVAGLIVFLALALLMAGLIVLRQGFVLRPGTVSGSSMEPHLHGPRLKWRCENCQGEFDFNFDCCKSGKRIRCPLCMVVSSEPLDTASLDSIRGEQVEYAPLRLMRSNRSEEILAGRVHASGIRRGDCVVVRESVGSVREIKRIVGFPEEKISIDQGDLFVNGVRFSKSIDQSLRQAILIHHWDRNYGEGWRGVGKWTIGDQPFESGIISKSSIAYSLPSGRQIDNQLDRNAHDSHRVVPARDFGVAVQYSKLPKNGTVRISIEAVGSYQSVILECDSMEVRVRTARNSAHLPTASQHSVVEDSGSHWLIVAVMDGHLLVGDPYVECVREELTSDSTLTTASAVLSEDLNGASGLAPKSPLTIEAIDGEFKLESILVFRDVVYRGREDAESQDWDAQDGVILLGDNVSCSSDSRDRWPNRLSIQAVKGVVVESANPIQELLKQR